MSTQSPSRAAQRQAATAARNQRADRSELAVSTTSPEWDGRPHHRRLPRLTSLLLVLGILALCVFLAITQISRRLADRDVLHVRQAVLTADPVVFESSAGGEIVEIRVKKGASVVAGQVVAVIRYDDPPGPEVEPATAELKAPANGIVSKVDVAAGQSVVGGAELLTMYRPDEMYFKVPLTYDDAADVNVGDKATFDVPGFGKVTGLVLGVQSDFGDAGTNDAERLANLVVGPDDTSKLSDAPPGVIADGKIDKNSAPTGAPSAIFAPR